MKYRKKPVEIEAIQWTGRNLDEISFFVGEALLPIERRPDYQLKIKTLEGDHAVSINNFVIKGIKGEFYSCRPDIFEETYELIK
jgi:hypothetical protein